MPRFASIIGNEEYNIGCTGQTVWVWDKNDVVLGKFKDLIYAYRAAISPLSDIFVVKSTDGRLAIYSLRTLSLIKKFRFSKINYAQDDGFCFSSDGQFFLNIERYRDELYSDIVVYNTTDFSLVSRFMIDEDMDIDHIQYVNGEYYVLGFDRLDDLIINFVAKFRDGVVCEKVKITEYEYEFYWMHLHQTLFGLDLNDGQIINKIHTLEDLWNYRKK